MHRIIKKAYVNIISSKGSEQSLPFYVSDITDILKVHALVFSSSQQQKRRLFKPPFLITPDMQ